MFILCLLRKQEVPSAYIPLFWLLRLELSKVDGEFNSEVLPSLVIEARVDGGKARTGYGGETWEKETTCKT